MKSVWLPALSGAALLLGSLPAAAQMVVSAKSGVVNYTQGQVFLNDQAVHSSLTKYPDVKENGVLRTGAGRAEVLLTPGVILRMGENSSLKMITNRLVDTRLELQSGSAVVEAVETAKDNHVTMVVKNGAAGIAKAGIYRFDSDPAQVKVFRGEAAVEINGETTTVGGGRSLLLDGDSAKVEKFKSEDTDSLDHWSRQRGELLAMANPSTARAFAGGGYSSFYNPLYGGLYDGLGMGYGMGYGLGYGGLYGGMGGMGCNAWGYNPWYAMYTYVPCQSYFTSPYGYGYYSPGTANRVFTNASGMGFHAGPTGARSTLLGRNPRSPAASLSMRSRPPAMGSARGRAWSGGFANRGSNMGNIGRESSSGVMPSSSGSAGPSRGASMAPSIGGGGGAMGHGGGGGAVGHGGGGGGGRR